jgi:hypothetical protein
MAMELLVGGRESTKFEKVIIPIFLKQFRQVLDKLISIVLPFFFSVKIVKDAIGQTIFLVGNVHSAPPFTALL